MPLLSEIIDGVRTSEGVIHSGTINDKAAGVFNTAYAVGCIIAPILGGYLNMYTNFRVTCDTMAFSSLTYALIFFVVIILPGFCKSASRNSNELDLINSPVHLLRNHERLSAYSQNRPTSFKTSNRGGSEYQNINHAMSSRDTTTVYNTNHNNRAAALNFSESQNNQIVDSLIGK